MIYDKSFSPIALFVYNRADHLRETYNALCKCIGAAETDLFIFSDGAKNEGAALKVEEVRKELELIKNDKYFKNINIIESKENKGLAKSIISGVSEIIEKYGKIIVLEDDCVPSVNMLTYFNGALDFYEKDLNVGSIAGYTPQLSFPNDFNDDVFLAYRSCSWGWATWQRSWQNVDWEMKNTKKLLSKCDFIRDFTVNGTDRIVRLYRQLNGDGTSWSVRFGAHLTAEKLMTIYPKYSYIENIGCDASGVHSKAEDAEKMKVNIKNAIESPTFKKTEINKKIQKIMKKHYSAGILSDIKRTFAIVLIYLRCKANL